MREFSMVTNQHYSHSAYTGLTKSLQHHWTLFQRVIPDITHLFLPVKSAITEQFVPVLYLGKVSESVRMFASFPVKCEGIAITNPFKTSQPNYEACTLVCLHLIQAIQGKSELFEMSHDGCLLSQFCSPTMPKDGADITRCILLEIISLPPDQ